MLMPSIFGENLFEDLFDNISKPVKNAVRYTAPSNNVMRTDIRETENGFDLDIDLPGYKKEDLKAELKDGYLTISAAVENDKEEKAEDGKYIRRERYYGTCSRSFYVGEDIKQEEIKAHFEDGILKVFVPKKEVKPKVEESKYITIEG